MNIEIKKNMKIVTPDEGYVMTNWDGVDILGFSYCRVIYAPLNAELNYREITEEEKDIYKKQLEEKIREMEYDRNQ